MSATTTLDLDWSQGAPRPQEPLPGAVAVLVAGQPDCVVLPLDPTGMLELGRGHALGDRPLNDSWMSRQHLRIRRRGEYWEVADLQSRNGTALDGQLLNRAHQVLSARVVRAGTTLLLLRADLRPYLENPVDVVEGVVVGPLMAAVFKEIGRASQLGNTLHIVGESGSGKELAARAFHALGAHRTGRFIAVNCAAIPEGVAERLLFGARKGAFSGADAHADGYVQAADGGTLFLDEVAELDLAVQAKLLRVLENREVLALGASRPQAVDLHICSATHKDLRAEVSAGRLREDLYFRLSRPEVNIPPLRERLEEMPLLVWRTLTELRSGLVPHASLVEACMLRHWPGNVRELVAEVRTAGHLAIGEGVESVEERHLPAEAGQPFESPGVSPVARVAKALSREDIEAALAAEGGNVSQAARVLGLHRTQLRRLVARYGITVRGATD